MSLKIEMMVDHVKATNKDWKLMPKGFIRFYLRDKFKCSKYMARKAVQKLYDHEE
jgi:hypothetical protein